MPLKFRLKGLAETFIDSIRCPICGHDGGEEGNEGFTTDLTKVTFDGIVIVVQCEHCDNVFVPDGQRLGIVNSQRLRGAVQNDSAVTGQPVYHNLSEVRLDVERLNALRCGKVQ